MITYFAGPICEGAECAPILFIIVAAVVVPIFVGSAIVSGLTFAALKLVGWRRKKPFSTKASLIIIACALAAAGFISFVALVYPRTNNAKQRYFDEAVAMVNKEEILLPAGEERQYTDMYIWGSKFNYYHFLSEYGDGESGYTIRQDYERDELRKIDPKLKCEVIPEKDIEYCRESDRDRLAFNVHVGEYGVEMSFSPDYDEAERREVIEKLQPFVVGEIDRVYVQERPFGKRYNWHPTFVK